MRDLIVAAKCVLFDFDGPICRLFHVRPATAMADALREIVFTAEQDASWLPRTSDPLEILQAAFEQPALVESGLARDIERALTEEEVQAAAGAFPTAYADTLIRTLAATGRRLAITTNNSQQAVERYLSTRMTSDLFAGRIHGRSAEGSPRLKPDPDCLLRALKSTDTQAQEAVMIGDAPRDLEAARAAGVAFLGYARNEAKEAQLREAGAEHIVDSLRDVVMVVDPRAHV
jgi:HAD superfamily hydrolase (TIGR01509 family)